MTARPGAARCASTCKPSRARSDARESTRGSSGERRYSRRLTSTHSSNSAGALDSWSRVRSVAGMIAKGSANLDAAIVLATAHGLAGPALLPVEVGEPRAAWVLALH